MNCVRLLWCAYHLLVLDYQSIETMHYSISCFFYLFRIASCLLVFLEQTQEVVPGVAWCDLIFFFY